MSQSQLCLLLDACLIPFQLFGSAEVDSGKVAGIVFGFLGCVIAVVAVAVVALRVYQSNQTLKAAKGFDNITYDTKNEAVSTNRASGQGNIHGGVLYLNS